jgi:hypothetical protein
MISDKTYALIAFIPKTEKIQACFLYPLTSNDPKCRRKSERTYPP